MPMLGGNPSKLSKDLGNIRAQLKTGKTRGQNPRELTPDEIATLEERRDALVGEMQRKAKERVVTRINEHTAAQVDRAVEAVPRATATLLRTDLQEEGRQSRGHATNEANRVIAHLVPTFGPDVENATPEQLRKRKAAAVEGWDQKILEADGKVKALRKMTPAQLRAELSEMGEETHGTKAVMVRRLVNAGRTVAVTDAAAGRPGDTGPGHTVAATGAAAGSPTGAGSGHTVASTDAAAGSPADTGSRQRGGGTSSLSACGAAWPLATPLDAQTPDVRILLQAAGDLVQRGLITPDARTRYFAAMAQHLDVYELTMARVETLSLAQLKELCALLRLQAPASLSQLEEARAAVAKKRIGADEYRIARFLAEQVACDVKFLASQPELLNAGSLVRHAPRRVVETVMVLGPVVFHNEDSELALSYRAISLDSDDHPRLRYVKNLREVLVRAPEPLWLPACLDAWTPPPAAQEFLEQAQSGKCFLVNADLVKLARDLQVPLPSDRRDNMMQALYSWAAHACVAHAQEQLREPAPGGSDATTGSTADTADDC